MTKEDFIEISNVFDNVELEYRRKAREAPNGALEDRYDEFADMIKALSMALYERAIDT